MAARKLSPKLFVLVVACGAGCAGIHVRARLSQARGTPDVAVEHASFDGVYLTGRLLVGVENSGAEDAGYVVIDRRLSEHAVVAVDDVLDCDGGSTVRSIAADAYYRSPRPDELLIVEPGYWFGKNFTLFIYDESMVNAPPPACLDALVSVHLAAMGPSGEQGHVRLKVRAYLAPDGGTDSGEGGPVDPPDAGEAAKLPRPAPGVR